MLSQLFNAFHNFRIADLFDIAIISVILYFTFSWLRKSASRSGVLTLVSTIFLYICANVFSMYLTSMLFQAGLTAVLVALVLVYQNDIRMAMEHLSAWGVYRSKHSLVASSKTIENLLETSSNLARDHIGALIVIKGRDSLDRHLSGGITLGGRISTPLLYSIFHPSTPSHDGAVIIEADRIEHFGVRLPLSHNSAEVGSTGTRHTAGLGVSERSDAFVIIVSEERGVISIASDGHLCTVSQDQLRIRLEAFYKGIFPEPDKSRWHIWFTRNMVVKLASLCCAVLLWTVFAFRIETVSRTYTVPVECRNIPHYCIVENPRPMQVQVSVSGEERAFTFDPASLVVSLDMRSTVDGSKTVSVGAKDINLPAGLKIHAMSPSTITVISRCFNPVDIPVKIRYSGKLNNGVTITDAKVHPSTVTLLVPGSRKNAVASIPTEPLDRAEVAGGTASFRLKLLPPAGTKLLNENDGEVRVVIVAGKH